VNPSENIGLARHLIVPPQGPLPEASYRAACGRAYYCVFAVARDLLLGGNFHVPTSGRAHQVVVDLLKSSRSAAVKALGGQLDELRHLRNRADYDVGSRTKPSSDFVPPKVQLRVLQAQKIAEELRAESGTDARLGIP